MIVITFKSSVRVRPNCTCNDAENVLRRIEHEELSFPGQVSLIISTWMNSSSLFVSGLEEEEDLLSNTSVFDDNTPSMRFSVSTCLCRYGLNELYFYLFMTWLSCLLSSSVLGSPGLLLSSSMITLALHHTIILIITHLYLSNHTLNHSSTQVQKCKTA